MRDAVWLLAFCVVAAAGAALPSSRAPSVSVTREGTGVGIVVAHVAHGVGVTVDVVPSAPPLQRFYEYDDARYARGRGMSDRFANGLPVHLRASLAYRGIAATVGRVDADELRGVLAGDARGVCLVVPGGILPATVRTRDRDELRSFLMRGGSVIWAGAPFDLFYSMPGSSGSQPKVSAPDPKPWKRLYGRTGPFDARGIVDSPPLRYGTVQAPLDRATGLTFDATTFGVNAKRLTGSGGTALAFVDAAGDSSVSQLPVGQGRVVIFGDAFSDEMDASRQIAQSVATGAWFAPRDVRAAAELYAGAPQTRVEVGRSAHAFAFGPPPFYFPFGY